jgi:hypothetical protein
MSLAPGQCGIELTCASGQGKTLMSEPHNLLNFQMITQFQFKFPNSKIESGTFLASKNYGKFKTDRLA